MRIIKRAFTVLMQAVAAQVSVFLLSALWYVEQVTAFPQFLFMVFCMWFGFAVGAYFAGSVALRPRADSFVKGKRLIYTALLPLLPFTVLLTIGAYVWSVNQSAFQQTVMEWWVPKLAFIGLIATITGFYLPGWSAKKYLNPPTQ